jgi:hypothetical protein
LNDEASTILCNLSECEYLAPCHDKVQCSVSTVTNSLLNLCFFHQSFQKARLKQFTEAEANPRKFENSFENERRGKTHAGSAYLLQKHEEEQERLRQTQRFMKKSTNVRAKDFDWQE